ncbi:MAG: putative toxin-antitoxin system toxin component, PIN family [Chloroflexota bacterium]
MTHLLVVLDTNILVSALLRSFGPSAQVLELVLTGALQVAFDDRILAEWREVLYRARFSFPTAEVDALLLYLEESGLRVPPTITAVLPDPDDAPFLEVASTCEATLITGNMRHYPATQRLGITVMEPRVFLDTWAARQQ